MSKNDKNLDLNCLSGEEADLIRDVLERDRQLKKREEDRLRKLQETRGVRHWLRGGSAQESKDVQPAAKNQLQQSLSAKIKGKNFSELTARPQGLLGRQKEDQSATAALKGPSLRTRISSLFTFKFQQQKAEARHGSEGEGCGDDGRVIPVNTAKPVSGAGEHTKISWETTLEEGRTPSLKRETYCVAEGESQLKTTAAGKEQPSSLITKGSTDPCQNSLRHEPVTASVFHPGRNPKSQGNTETGAPLPRHSHNGASRFHQGDNDSKPPFNVSTPPPAAMLSSTLATVLAQPWSGRLRRQRTEPIPGGRGEELEQEVGDWSRFLKPRRAFTGETPGCPGNDGTTPTVQPSQEQRVDDGHVFLVPDSSDGAPAGSGVALPPTPPKTPSVTSTRSLDSQRYRRQSHAPSTGVSGPRFRDPSSVGSSKPMTSSLLISFRRLSSSKGSVPTASSLINTPPPSPGSSTLPSTTSTSQERPKPSSELTRGMSIRKGQLPPTPGRTGRRELIDWLDLLNAQKNRNALGSSDQRKHSQQVPDVVIPSNTMTSTGNSTTGTNLNLLCSSNTPTDANLNLLHPNNNLTGLRDTTTTTSENILSPESVTSSSNTSTYAPNHNLNSKPYQLLNTYNVRKAARNSQNTPISSNTLIPNKNLNTLNNPSSPNNFTTPKSLNTSFSTNTSISTYTPLTPNTPINDNMLRSPNAQFSRVTPVSTNAPVSKNAPITPDILKSPNTVFSRNTSISTNSPVSQNAPFTYNPIRSPNNQFSPMTPISTSAPLSQKTPITPDILSSPNTQFGPRTPISINTPLSPNTPITANPLRSPYTARTWFSPNTVRSTDAPVSQNTSNTPDILQSPNTQFSPNTPLSTYTPVSQNTSITPDILRTPNAQFSPSTPISTDTSISSSTYNRLISPKVLSRYKRLSDGHAGSVDNLCVATISSPNTPHACATLTSTEVPRSFSSRTLPVDDRARANHTITPSDALLEGVTTCSTGAGKDGPEALPWQTRHLSLGRTPRIIEEPPLFSSHRTAVPSGRQGLGFPPAPCLSSPVPVLSSWRSHLSQAHSLSSRFSFDNARDPLLVTSQSKAPLQYTSTLPLSSVHPLYSRNSELPPSTLSRHHRFRSLDRSWAVPMDSTGDITSSHSCELLSYKRRPSLPPQVTVSTHLGAQPPSSTPACSTMSRNMSSFMPETSVRPSASGIGAPTGMAPSTDNFNQSCTSSIDAPTSQGSERIGASSKKYAHSLPPPTAYDPTARCATAVGTKPKGAVGNKECDSVVGELKPALSIKHLSANRSFLTFSRGNGNLNPPVSAVAAQSVTPMGDETGKAVGEGNEDGSKIDQVPNSIEMTHDSNESLTTKNNKSMQDLVCNMSSQVTEGVRSEEPAQAGEPASQATEVLRPLDLENKTGSSEPSSQQEAQVMPLPTESTQPGPVQDGSCRDLKNGSKNLSYQSRYATVPGRLRSHEVSRYLRVYTSEDVENENVFYSPTADTTFSVSPRKKSTSFCEPEDATRARNTHRNSLGSFPAIQVEYLHGPSHSPSPSPSPDRAFGLHRGRSYSVSSVQTSRPSGCTRISTGRKLGSSLDLSTEDGDETSWGPVDLGGRGTRSFSFSLDQCTALERSCAPCQSEMPPSPLPSPPESSRPAHRISSSSTTSRTSQEIASPMSRLPSKGYRSSLSAFEESDSDTTTDDEYYLGQDQGERETEL